MKPLYKPELEHLVGKIKAGLSSKQDKLTAGDNIAITNNTISATDTVYDDTAVQAELGKKADKTYVDNKVKTDVPLNAKFTDTITTVNGKTGVIGKADIVALGVPAQDTVYEHPATHSADMIVDGSMNKAFTATEKTKLAGVATGANKYIHPTKHPPSIITQDASNRFVTDAEKTAWNGKAAGSHTHDDRYYTETETDNKLKSYLPLSGGTLTGNLNGKYIIGTWLQATADNHMANTPAAKVAVLDSNGWVYYRTVAELLADLGIPGAASIRATTSVYGTTILSTSITSTSKTTAATPYAVKAALDEAKQYTDTTIGNAIAASY